MKRTDPRTRQRILSAACAVTTDSNREAAIVGGIAYVMCQLGSWSTQAAVNAAGLAHGLLQGLPGDASPIYTHEFRTALDRWKAQYELVQP